MIWDWRQALPPPHVACNPTYLLLPLYHGLGAAVSSACDDLESDWEGDWQQFVYREPVNCKLPSQNYRHTQPEDVYSSGVELLRYYTYP
uniref:Uncharacterized protein n=1 Tax=Oryza nivara TaxID=4536 RepID=A0A0E0GZN8_ORYNI